MGGVYIGVSANDFDFIKHWGSGGYVGGLNGKDWGLNVREGNLSYNAKKKAYGKKYSKIITLDMNWDSGEMWYVLDDIDYGVAYSNIHEENLYFAICMNQFSEGLWVLE